MINTMAKPISEEFVDTSGGVLRPENKVRRIAVLFSRLSGYMAACLKTLSDNHGIELLVYRTPALNEAPFDPRHFSWISALRDRHAATPEEILADVKAFEPQAIFMSGWGDSGYLRVVRALKKDGVPVIAGSDAQWNGSLRQQAGRVMAPWHLHSAIDVLWVAGERQRQLARRLGYTGARCWSGVYACDWSRFAEVHHRERVERPPAFLFVGRYLARKGLDVLIEAYRQYREMVQQPWPLICAGTGEHKSLLEGVEGIVDRGFVQPDELPDLLARAAAFVLPSNREPWGVAVQEAAAAGLPLICSDACGAAVHLLQDGYNGFSFETGNSRHLAQCLSHLSTLPEEEREAMRGRSHELSKQYTPERWAATLVNGVGMLCLNG